MTLEQKLNELFEISIQKRSGVWIRPNYATEADPERVQKIEAAVGGKVEAKLTFGTNNHLRCFAVCLLGFTGAWGVVRTHGGFECWQGQMTEAEAVAYIESLNITKGNLKWDRSKTEAIAA